MDDYNIKCRTDYILVDNGDLTKNLHMLVRQGNRIVSEIDLGDIESILIKKKELEEEIKKLKGEKHE